MKHSAILLLSALATTLASAQLPDPAELLGLRPPRGHEHHDYHHQEPAAHCRIVGNTVLLHLPGRAPVPVFRSDFHLRGALASPDGRIVAVVEGTGSAGDWITFLHRIDQAHGSRFIAEPLHGAVHTFVDFLYNLDPALQAKPARLRLSPVSVSPGNDFQFRLTGDNDLLGRKLTLVIKEDGQPVLFEGCDQ